ncbi:MAG: hypothetical protein L6300_13520 [Syntrophaceae bacterium]|nr:hypothetical protein [Syntrophaceae bacterium]
MLTMTPPNNRVEATRKTARLTRAVRRQHFEVVVNYRNLARIHLKSAKDELGTKSDQRLKYSALELRMAMEALTYDRALAYKDEFPPDEYETWQPRKVMSVLLEIDPRADKDSSLAIGIEEQYGVPAPKMNSLGSEKVLCMSVLRKHYDALGSYLHVQSMRQVRDGAILDFNRMRARCEEIASFVALVLSSPIFNVTLGSFANSKCVECESPIRKRIPAGQREVLAECHQCKATYTITDEGEGGVKWTPHQQEVECANTNCHQKIVVWHHELEVGRHWKCKNCNGENTFVLAISYKETPNTYKAS